MREKQLLIDFLCASAGGPMYYRGRDMLLVHRGMRISDSEMCFSVMPPRPWRSSRFLRPNSATWSRLFRVSKKNALNVDVRISRLPTRPLSDLPIWLRQIGGIFSLNQSKQSNLALADQWT
jgi:hypothetical protein